MILPLALAAAFQLVPSKPLAAQDAVASKTGNLDPILAIAKNQPLLRAELFRQLTDLPPRAGTDPKYAGETSARHLNFLWDSRQPRSPVPHDALEGELSGFAAALAAHPEAASGFLRALPDISPENPSAGQSVAAFESSLHAMGEEAPGRKRLNSLLLEIRRDYSLLDPAIVSALRARLDRIFDNLGPGADTPATLEGKNLPQVGLFKGQKIKKLHVKDGVAVFHTKDYFAEIGLRYRQGRESIDIAKDIRADIAKAKSAGSLPEARYSVTTDRRSTEDKIFIRAKVAEALLGGEEQKELNRIESVLRAIAKRYLRDVAIKGRGDDFGQLIRTYVTVEKR